VLTVLAHLIERGDYEELHEIIKRQGPQMARIQARRPRAGGIEGDGGVTAWAESPADRRELPQRCASCSNPRPREAV
jgi:hypothetical protein